MRRNGLKKIKALVLAGLVLVSLFKGNVVALAAESGYTATATGTYRNPVTNEIEDSGGEDQYALGQSMVDSMVDTTAYIAEDGSSYAAYFKFHLMDNISKVSFETADASDGTFSAASFAKVGTTDESTDFYVPLPSKDSIVRATCYVDAMGRSVVFFVSFSDLKAGSNTAFSAYDGSGLTESDVTDTSATSTVSNTTAATGDGLTIGYASTEEATATESQDADSEEDGLVLDDSVWAMLFAVVFTAVFAAGLLLIIIGLLIRKIQTNKEKLHEYNMKKYERFEETEEDFNPSDILLGE